MNAEQIEYELTASQGAMVTVVRPGYGTQSDSWPGRLSVVTDNYPSRFQVSNECWAMLFYVGDVSSFSRKLRPLKDGGEYEVIIRLKGPDDYRQKLMPALHWSDLCFTLLILGWFTENEMLRLLAFMHFGGKRTRFVGDEPFLDQWCILDNHAWHFQKFVYSYPHERFTTKSPDVVHGTGD